MTAAPRTASAPRLALYQPVRTRVAVAAAAGERAVQAGEVGTVIEILETPWLAYMVEFDDPEGLTLPILRPEDLEPWSPPANQPA